MEDVELVELPQRRRNELPRWAVRLAGVDLGVIEMVRIGGARVTFYRALAVIPGSRELANLELDTDREKLTNKILEFSRDPWKYERHLTRAQRKILFGKEESPPTYD